MLQHKNMAHYGLTPRRERFAPVCVIINRSKSESLVSNDCPNEWRRILLQQDLSSFIDEYGRCAHSATDAHACAQDLTVLAAKLCQASDDLTSTGCTQ